jgi:hypothetical protein
MRKAVAASEAVGWVERNETQLIFTAWQALTRVGFINPASKRDCRVVTPRRDSSQRQKNIAFFHNQELGRGHVHPEWDIIYLEPGGWKSTRCSDHKSKAQALSPRPIDGGSGMSPVKAK